MGVRRVKGPGGSNSVRRILILVVASLALIMPTAAPAQERGKLLATQETGFGRLVLTFPDRMDLPGYRVKYDNGVLAIEFDTTITVPLPDIASAMPDYATIARVDPDGKGIRIGLRSAFNVNSMAAGEKLFVDLLPPTWQGLPPALPPEVITDLAERAQKAAQLAEEQRRVEEAKVAKPVATVRVGRNPTFLRLQFDWNVDTGAKFALEEHVAQLDFDWPVAIDLYALKANMPAEFKGADNTVGRAASRVSLKVAEGVTPRFYQLSPRQFVIDIDTSPEEGLKAALAAEESARKEKEAADAAAIVEAQQRTDRLGMGQSDAGAPHSDGHGKVVPTVSTVGNTIRVAFPFDADTAAAVYRRGNTVWMVFDTSREIAAPAPSEALSQVASGMEVIPAGDTKVVRMDLAVDRLATLGSEGRSWVLSLGDVMLNATEPMTLSRRRDRTGQLEMAADVERPGKVHVIRDPVVGDTLEVVTLMPPARGLIRDMAYVDFEALQSAHGLVVRPLGENLSVEIADKEAIISVKGGLTLSSAESVRTFDSGNAPQFRESYLDLGQWQEDDPLKFAERREEIIARAAGNEGRLRDVARLELGQFLIANDFSYEAIGVLRVLEDELSSEDLRKKLRLCAAIADTEAGRTSEALEILNSGSFPEETDALMWRAIARADAGDFRGARLDTMSALPVYAGYPTHIRHKFLFAGLRAAVETRDDELALKLVPLIDFATLDPDQVTLYQLMQARMAENEGHTDEAIDKYGRVITADVRPTRAEAVYRTLLLLRSSGKLDLAKATDTLSAESLIWRGGRLDSDIQKLLAELYFAAKNYKLGFDTARQAAARFPDSASTGELMKEAQTTFEDLYLNGAADQLSDVDALSLFYDFRQLTPPGSRGDEMIRNLARRLVKVDLLKQAADLLEYQIDSRLTGAAKAQVATDLAVIRIADRDPEGALRVLHSSTLAEVSPQLDRQRRILEARALIDAGRQELAIDLISRLEGRDADMLRIDGYWKAKNYDMAADLLEIVYSPPPGALQMTRDGRTGVIRAAVGYVLANDKIGLSRLRAKFSDQLANSAEWPVFEFVTRDVAPESREFKKLAKEIAGIDSLDAFLASYRELYAAEDATMMPAKSKAPGAAA